MIQKLALLICFVFFLNISLLQIGLGNIYLAICLGVLLLLLFVSKSYKLNKLHFLILFGALLSILNNQIPEFFKPYERLIIFLGVGSLVGPLLRNDKLDFFRQKLFSYLNTAMLIFVSISAVGLNLGVSVFTNFSGFNGLFNHSMMMGPLAAIALLNSLYLIKSTDDIKMQRLFYLTAGLSFYACVAAGSRGAIIAGILGILFFFFKIYQENLSSFFKALLLLVSIAFLTFPLWQSQTDFLMNKMEYSEEAGDFTASRNILWESRIKEFKSSPIFGVGFASVDTSLNNTFDASSGKVEPGSSWLVILSMIGMVGFIPFLLLYFYQLKSTFVNNRDRVYSGYLGGLLVLFSIHMIGEGYVLSAGSGLFFYLWLLLGVADIHRKEEDFTHLKISYLQK